MLLQSVVQQVSPFLDSSDGSSRLLSEGGSFHQHRREKASFVWQTAYYIKSTKRVNYCTVFKRVIPGVYKKILFHEINPRQQLL